MVEKVRLKLALEVDGPAHFTKNTARPLGHMVLKHRTLTKMGWTVVSVSHYLLLLLLVLVVAGGMMGVVSVGGIGDGVGNVGGVGGGREVVGVG